MKGDSKDDNVVWGVSYPLEPGCKGCMLAIEHYNFCINRRGDVYEGKSRRWVEDNTKETLPPCGMRDVALRRSIEPA